MKQLLNLNRSGRAGARPQPVPTIPTGSLMAFNPEAPLVGASTTLLIRISDQGYLGRTLVLSPDDYQVSGNDFVTYALICFSDRVADTGGFAVHTLARVIGMSEAGMVLDKTCYTCSLDILCHPGQAGRNFFSGPLVRDDYSYYKSGHLTVNLTFLEQKDLSDQLFFRPSYDRLMLDLDETRQTATRWAYLQGHGFGCQMLDSSGNPNAIFPIELKPSFGDNISVVFKNYNALHDIPPEVIGGVPTMGLMAMDGSQRRYEGFADLFSPLFVRKAAEDNWELYWSYIYLAKDSQEPKYYVDSCYVRQGDDTARYWFEREFNYFMFDVPFTPTSIARP